jgi:hypothetical protein
VETTKQKEERRKKPKPEEQEGMPQHEHSPPHLLQSVAKVGTQITMTGSTKTLNEFSPHIPPKTPKTNISSSMTNELLHADITVKTQRTRVSITHAKEATHSYKNSQAISQRSRHSRQPALILQSEGTVLMDRLNRRRAKQSGSAEVNIEFALLSSQSKTARECETSTYMKNICVRASTRDHHINNI